jgi:hypothetical protein
MADDASQRSRARAGSNDPSSNTWAPSRSRLLQVIPLGLLVVSLAACSTEYHGYDSDIDGVLWRQVASFEDPFSLGIYQSREHDPTALIASLPGKKWDGTLESAERLDITEGGLVVYDESSSRDGADLSVFISSGPRPDQTQKRERTYSGPSAVFTCYSLHLHVEIGGTISKERVILDDCPDALVDKMPDDAAFASREVFDG